MVKACASALTAVTAACAIKDGIVAREEREGGPRRLPTQLAAIAVLPILAAINFEFLHPTGIGVENFDFERTGTGDECAQVRLREQHVLRLTGSRLAHWGASVV